MWIRIFLLKIIPLYTKAKANTRLTSLIKNIGLISTTISLVTWRNELISNNDHVTWCVTRDGWQDKPVKFTRLVENFVCPYLHICQFVIIRNRLAFSACLVRWKSWDFKLFKRQNLAGRRIVYFISISLTCFELYDLHLRNEDRSTPSSYFPGRYWQVGLCGVPTSTVSEVARV